MESETSFQSDTESEISSEDGLGKQQRGRRFTAIQTATLNAYYRAGMRGEGKRHIRRIERCSSELGLTATQVKVCYVDNHVH